MNKNTLSIKSKIFKICFKAIFDTEFIFQQMKIVHLSLLALSLNLLAQKADFTSVDTYARNLPKSEARSVSMLAKSLTKNAKTDAEKVRAFYVWIAANISYDFGAYRSGNVPDQSADKIFMSKKAVCQGYSELFYQLCKLNNIDCAVIAGYSKGFGYKPGKKFLQTDHAWNAVKIDNKWYLLDATWGSGYINENSDYVSFFTEEHYLTDPRNFIIKHLPADPMWQLFPAAISIRTFEKDSTAIKAALQAKPDLETINYLDSLKTWEKLDSVGRLVNSSLRIVRYNPDNSDAWYKLGWFYFQQAWEKMSKLNDPAIQRNKSLARPLAQEAIYLQKEALKYLNEVNKRDPFYADDVKQKKDIIAQNMKSLEQIAK